MGNTIGEKIAILRKTKNLSQSDIAKVLYVSNKTVSKWECGNGIPDIETLKKLADFFDVTLDYFVGNETQKVKPEVKKARKFPLKTLIISFSITFAVIFLILLAVFVPRTPNVKSFQFNIDTETSTMSCVVSNSDKNFSFNGKIKVPLRNTWKIYSDINATNEITSNVVELQEGDNTFYLLVTNSGNDKKLYTVTIRRKPMYVVTFNTIGGTYVENQIIEEGQCAREPKEPTKAGYTFIKWNYDFNDPIISTTTINANYAANEYSIFYHYQDNIIYQPVVFGKITNLKRGDIFNKDYYYISSWSSNENGLDKLYNCNSQYTYSQTNNLDLYPVWKPITYYITYVLDGGTNGNNPTSYNIECNNFNLNEPQERMGFDFDGWYYDSTYKNKVNSEIVNSIGNLTFYAKWNAIYNISGNSIISLTDYGKTLTDLSIPSHIDNVSITRIENDAFRNCKKIINIDLPSSITYIGDYAFANCSKLKTITLSTNLTTINKGLFAMCSSLSKITLPEKVSSIKTNAFGWCSHLTEILVLGYLYSSNIEEDVAPDCSNLKVFFYKGGSSREEYYALTNKFHRMVYLYSYTEPSNGEFLYWHYQDGNVEIWD